MNELQKYVCNKKGIRPGNYAYYANVIENDGIRENLAILLEYGIPASAVKKLERYIPDSFNQDKVLEEIKNKKLYEESVFISYEKEKLKENI